MGLREDITRKIGRKRAEIADLHSQVKVAESYVQALEDTLKMLPREQSPASVANGNGAAHGLRKQSMTGRAYGALRAAGGPMHITEILKAIGKPVNRVNRSGLASSLAVYARKGEIFTKTAPNTFGLAGRDEASEQGDGLFAEGMNEPAGG